MNNTTDSRLHALDAVRGFALLLGVAFHAALSYMPGMPPGVWFAADHSSSSFLSDAAFVTHIFRMSLFFFIAGYFGRLLYQKLGARSFWANRLQRILIPLVAGWVILAPIIGYLWQAGLAKVFGGTLPPMPAMPAGFFPLGHLWFLYQLLLIYVVVVTVRSLIDRLDPAQKLRGLVDRAVSGSIRTMAGTFTLGLPVAAALMSLAFWFYWMGIPTHDVDSAGPGIGRIRHCVRVRLAGASFERCARSHRAALDCKPGRRDRRDRLAAALHARRADGAAGPDQDGLRPGVRRGFVGLGARAHGRCVALPI
jgi:peptidoglycan/LPS O-acetylase OafA/YrhL